MHRFRRLCRVMGLPLAVVFFFTTVSPTIVTAGLVSTERVVVADRPDGDRARVDAFMQRDDVRRQLETLGVDPNEAAARVKTLSDAEIGRIAGRLDTLPAGEGALEAVLIVFGVVFLVLIVTDLLGITNVFPFIR